jgi:hypothetical protein
VREWAIVEAGKPKNRGTRRRLLVAAMCAAWTRNSARRVKEWKWEAFDRAAIDPRYRVEGSPVEITN